MGKARRTRLPATRGGPARRAALGLAALAALLLHCAAPNGAPGDAPSAASSVDPPGTPAGSAAAWLSPEVPLPPRPEVVALSDALAIAAGRAEPGAETARLAWLAAELRARLWRLDRVASDGREALELYAQAVQSGAGGALGCRADFRRATFEAAQALDAERAYGELYLALRRQQAVGEPRDAEHARCLTELAAALKGVEAYRPTGTRWDDLVSAADAAAASYATGAAQAGHAGGGAPGPSGSAVSAAPPLPPLSSGALRDVVLAPSGTAVGDGPVELVAVQPFSWEGGARVVLTLSAPARYDVGSLAPDADAGKGHRIYVDVARASARKLKKELAASGLLERVRLGRQKDGTRVVLDLAASAKRRVFYLPEPFRIVVDLSTLGDDAPPAGAPAGQRPLRRIVLDPGHGGTDDGAVGPTGLREKDVTLDIAHRAAPALAHELGIETLITRDTDTYVYLEERAARANAYHADLFVSIHCNATENGEARGFEIYVLDPSREMDAVARRTAMRENATAGAASATTDPRALDAQVAAVAAGLSFGDVVARSRRFADLLGQATQGSLAERYGATRDHGVRTAAFYVLVGAEMPAALFETAFISNPEDEARLATADYRQKLADAVVNAVRAYRDGR
ncbi:MAG: N-acetylmuramoyl-L-alanine amidase [Polyangiaceae bacterium]|nr:N-acetylmuramoyl-L-alanine amidase [Polyangiaceae bacterium]